MNIEPIANSLNNAGEVLSNNIGNDIEFYCSTDNQNGLEDNSLWFEDVHEDDLIDILNKIGLETFKAPNDTSKHFSTYGILISKISEIRDGDRVRIKPNWYPKVVDIRILSDGGPWVTKDNDFVAIYLTTRTNRNYLLITPVENRDNVTLYHKSDNCSSGWMKHPEQPPNSIYRLPRTNEIP
jgi:hypothetical protein